MSAEQGEPAPATAPRVVRAAGGVVMRPDGDAVEVLLVHRPRYDDWSFPKGKCDAGEPEETAALREVEEETGYRCTLGAHLGTVEYVDARGRDKVVRYWTMSVVDGEFEANEEVDDVEWLPVPSARDRLTYHHDRRVLDLATA
jgi:8-oxo-dGTP pyrophosphatase MutT (NUDIX family)